MRATVACLSVVFSSFAAVCPTGRAALPKHSCIWGTHGNVLTPPVQHICEWRKPDAYGGCKKVSSQPEMLVRIYIVVFIIGWRFFAGCIVLFEKALHWLFCARLFWVATYRYTLPGWFRPSVRLRLVFLIRIWPARRCGRLLLLGYPCRLAVGCLWAGQFLARHV